MVGGSYAYSRRGGNPDFVPHTDASKPNKSLNTKGANTASPLANAAIV